MGNQQLTDRQRVRLAQLAYQQWQVGDPLYLNHGRNFIGKVTRIIHQVDDLYLTVIVNHQQQEVTVLFRGSTGIISGGHDAWVNQWLKTNFPVGSAILTQQADIPDQLVSASATLNRLMGEYRGAHFWLYGHSLGSINAQYALANCFFPQQLANSYLFEGPNIYWLLSPDQRKRALQIRCQIFNYVDPRDIVTLGYLDEQHVIGLLRVVDSRLVAPIKQHLFGGYQYDRQNMILVNQGASAELSRKRAMIDRRLIKRAGQLLQMVDHRQNNQYNQPSHSGDRLFTD
ncbi:hypothetical protein [uncultured Limosilactobacillus sp.]|uniref:hypothetical protein n=1 Tax=uncultured Limosilactobacillus sp. TaxID=2837629 RepID=UPI0025D7E5F1|nr:hypothetical protein [uncultured Limosilactobacillus sp.]